jgi:uncharacterized surface protein with fasciclin (FAS1) repeats
MRTFIAGLLAVSISVGAHASEATNQQSDIVDTAVAAGQFKTLATALKAGGLVKALKGKGPFTVFAPTDEAFSKVPKKTLEMLLKPENKAKLAAILKYHVVSGKVTAKQVMTLKNATTLKGSSVAVQFDKKNKTVSIDGAKVVKADIVCSNGVIHVIDKVILPRPDVVDTAVKAGSFKTLAAAAKAAGLVKALKGDGPFTIFAPTDEAFAKLPKGTVENLLLPENKDKLAAVLKYHVVAGNVLAADVVKLKKAKTLQGSEVKVRVDDGKVMIDNAQVIKADVLAGNGVIHVIDSVILPK